MSVEAYLNVTGECGQVANAGGWEALSEWVDGLPIEECEATDHLLAYGYRIGLDDLATEVDALLRRDDIPQGVDEVLQALADALGERTDEDERIDIREGI